MNLQLSLAPIIALLAGILILAQPRLLNYIVPDRVHVMANGRIVRSGDKHLALELEKNGYADFEQDTASGAFSAVGAMS